MGAWQDIFSLITNSLKYFLSADSSLYLVQFLIWDGDTEFSIDCIDYSLCTKENIMKALTFSGAK